MPRFFVSEGVIAGPGVALSDALAQHVRALRLRVGDALTLFDHSAQEWSARIAAIEKRAICVDIDAPPTLGLGLAEPHLTLALALIANDRMDWVIQKATELGVARIAPIRAARSQSPGLAERKADHWRAVAIAAAEQCGRVKWPEIMPPSSCAAETFAALGEQHLYCERDATSTPSISGSGPIVVWIGPEGGWTLQERELFLSQNSGVWTLSRATLRAETAAIAACARLLQR
jgi:16S rRNA (uracil1498-N3)-methyltransferase